MYLPHPPTPAARPKFSKWGPYYPKTYQSWRANTEANLARYERPGKLTTLPVYVTVHSVCKRPKKLTVELPRGDVDNFAKAVLDAITRSELIWVDDTQVKVLTTGKRYAHEGEEPHTYIGAALHPFDMPTLEEDHRVGDDVYDLPPEDRESHDGE